MIRRGDVVIVDFPFPDTGQSKIRPALVIQNDRDNQKLRKTIIAMITSNLRRRGDPSHLFVDPGTSAGTSSGLSFSLPCLLQQSVHDRSEFHPAGHRPFV